jgi:hypothetical protein
MGPATPSRFALNEAFWSGTFRSAGYEWSSEPISSRDYPAHPRLIDISDDETA